MKIVLGIVGQPAAGKGTIAAYLKSSYGAESYRFSDPLSATAAALSLPLTRDTMIRLSESLRAAFGQDLLSKAVAARAEASTADLVVVDGVRREDDVAALKALPGFKLVAVTAEVKARFVRAKQRAEKSDEATLTFEQFQALEQRSTEVTARELEAKADFAVGNDGNLEDLEKEIDNLLGGLGVKKI